MLDVEQAVVVMDAMMAGGDGSMNSDVNLAENEKTIEVFENDLSFSSKKTPTSKVGDELRPYRT